MVRPSALVCDGCFAESTCRNGEILRNSSLSCACLSTAASVWALVFFSRMARRDSTQCLGIKARMSPVAPPRRILPSGETIVATRTLNRLSDARRGRQSRQPSESRTRGLIQRRTTSAGASTNRRASERVSSPLPANSHGGGSSEKLTEPESDCHTLSGPWGVVSRIGASSGICPNTSGFSAGMC